MGPARSYYQRLVARDENEAAALVAGLCAGRTRGTAVYDEVFVPALNHAQRDHLRGRITDADVALRRADDPPARRGARSPAAARPSPRLARRLPILGLPAREEADEIVLHDAEAAARSGALRGGGRVARSPGQRGDRGRRGARAGRGPDRRAWPAAPAMRSISGICASGCGRASRISRSWWDGGARTEATTPRVTRWWRRGPDRVTVSLAEACAQLQELAPLQRAPGPTAAAAVPLTTLVDAPDAETHAQSPCRPRDTVTIRCRDSACNGTVGGRASRMCRWNRRFRASGSSGRVDGSIGQPSCY